MVLVTRSWRLWLVGMAASLVIFAVVYFAVIQPAQNTADINGWGCAGCG